MPANTNEISQGPAELFEKVTTANIFVTNGLRFERHVSPASLLKLIDRAFRASFAQVEGRPLRFCIFISKENPKPSNRIVAGMTPFVCSLEALCHIGAVVPPRPMALFVTEDADELYCHGIGRFAKPSLKDAHPSGIESRADGVVVSIDGPGSITVDGILWQVQLLHGDVVVTEAFRNAPSFRTWSEQVADAIVSEFREPDSDSHKMPCATIRNAWNSILESMVSAKHGGAIAVLPGDIPFDLPLPTWVNDHFQTAYRSVDLDLGKQSYDFMTDVDENPDVYQLASGDRLSDTIDVVGKLANLDGCIVFDRRLRLAGCGWVIHGKVAPPPMIAKLGRDGKSESEVTLDRRGTRHRSAAGLCHSMPETNVFVVSQDGPIRHFFSDQNGRVVAAGPFHVVRDFPP